MLVIVVLWRIPYRSHQCRLYHHAYIAVVTSLSNMADYLYEVDHIDVRLYLRMNKEGKRTFEN